MDYFLQVFTIAYTLTAYTYSSIKLYKLGQAHFSHSKVSGCLEGSIPCYAIMGQNMDLADSGIIVETYNFQ